MSSKRLTQGMLQLSLTDFVKRNAPQDVIALIADVRKIQAERNSRDANTHFLLDRLGLHLAAEYNEAYFAEALDYHLGLLHAYLGQPEQMADHISRSHTMPSHEDDQLFSDHVNLSHVGRDHQKQAIQRGLPPIVFACMPRSASATLAHTVAQLLDLPVLRVSIGRFPNYFLAPSWLDAFLEGGAITQDHFGASDFNVGVLRSRGPIDVFVLARDPRAAARSQVHFKAGSRSESGHLPLKDLIESECIHNFIPWLQRWLDCSVNQQSLRIHWITFNEICRDIPAIVRRISAVLQSTYPAMKAYTDCASVAVQKHHFVSGDDDAWRREVDKSVQARLWQACTPQVRELLRLTP